MLPAPGRRREAKDARSYLHPRLNPRTIGRHANPRVARLLPGARAGDRRRVFRCRLERSARAAAGARSTHGRCPPAALRCGVGLEVRPLRPLHAAPATGAGRVSRARRSFPEPDRGRGYGQPARAYGVHHLGRGGGTGAFALARAHRGRHPRGAGEREALGPPAPAGGPRACRDAARRGAQLAGSLPADADSAGHVGACAANGLRSEPRMLPAAPGGARAILARTKKPAWRKRQTQPKSPPAKGRKSRSPSFSD